MDSWLWVVHVLGTLLSLLSRGPVCVCVCVCVCVFANINQIHNDLHCTYAYMCRACMYECLHMYVYICARVGMYCYCPGFQELWRFQGSHSWFAFMTRSARGSQVTLKSWVLAPPRGGHVGHLWGYFSQYPWFLYLLCVCAHTYTHTLYIHTL